LLEKRRSPFSAPPGLRFAWFKGVSSVPPAGFSLVEALVAAAIFSGAITSLAALTAAASRVDADARRITVATMAAKQKIEELRSLGFLFDVHGERFTDGSADTASPQTPPTGGTGLRPSPLDALSVDASGYVDYLDASGQVLAATVSPPLYAAYLRRWSILPLPADAADTLVIQVRVAPLPPARSGSPSPRPAAGEVTLVTVRTRRAM
jgi:type II secretory pathway pseudopilin PulG